MPKKASMKNSRCACGSGLKAKYCCYRQQNAMLQAARQAEFEFNNRQAAKRRAIRDGEYKEELFGDQESAHNSSDQPASE